MGIVVCVSLGLGVAALLQLSWTRRIVVEKAIAVQLFVLGLWNAAWYGLQHVDEFWGVAAMVSGGLMILSALAIVLSVASRARTDEAETGPVTNQRAAIIRRVLLFGMTASFLLYLVALIQLNLGFPVVGL